MVPEEGTRHVTGPPNVSYFSNGDYRHAAGKKNTALMAYLYIFDVP
jgi:hypothetical protein